MKHTRKENLQQTGDPSHGGSGVPRYETSVRTLSNHLTLRTLAGSNELNPFIGDETFKPFNRDLSSLNMSVHAQSLLNVTARGTYTYNWALKR
jgi:hypothetical protein